jgi:uncharacterized protein (TIGR02246 family)
MTAIQLRAAGVIAVLAAVGLLATSGLTKPQAPPSRETPGRQKESSNARHSAPNPHSQDEQAIRKAFADYVYALSKGNSDAILSHWAEEGDYTNEAGEVIHGREAIGAACKPAMPNLKGHKASGRVRSVKFIRPDVALVDGELNYTAPDGNRETTRLSSAWVKSGDRWLISCAREEPGESSAEASTAYQHLKQLEWLVGERQGEGAKAEVRSTCDWAPEKSFLVLHYVVERGDSEPKLVTLRIGWDPANETIRSWVFDSLGGFGDGTWRRDGNQWIVESTGVLPDGGTGSSTDVWQFVDENTYMWKSTDREIDGQPMPDAEVKFVRKTAAAREDTQRKDTHREGQP